MVTFQLRGIKYNVTENKIKRVINNYVVNNNGCFIYQGHKPKLKNKNYGKISLWRNGKSYVRQVSNIVWVYYNGDILDNKFVLHTCDNPACINPKHLYLGTHLQNMRDKINRGRANGYGSKPRITKLEYDEIMVRLSKGESYRGISKLYPVSKSLVSRIDKGTYIMRFKTE